MARHAWGGIARTKVETWGVIPTQTQWLTKLERFRSALQTGLHNHGVEGTPVRQIARPGTCSEKVALRGGHFGKTPRLLAPTPLCVAPAADHPANPRSAPTPASRCPIPAW